MTRCYIFDIDGTIADNGHRLHFIQKEPKDWDGFFAACVDDPPIEHIIDLICALEFEREVVLVSGRSDQVRTQTEQWLDDQCVPYSALYMRRASDHRDDHVIKLEMLAQLRVDGYDPVMAFDDRTRVVEAWRAAGIPCAQVAEGEF